VSERGQAFVVVVNPRAGAGAAKAKLPALQEALREAGATFEVVLTRFAGDATAQVREALRRGVAGVAVVGGDGTLNEAVNGFFEESGQIVAPGAWLGPLPCGTGGDFRRTVGIAKDPAAMVTQMMWAKPRPIDVGWLKFKDHSGADAQRAFINIASFGMGGLVDTLVNDGPKWIGGRAAFLLGGFRALTRYTNQRVRISLDDGPPRETEVLNFAVANGQFFGAGMHIAPRAKLDDGLFDVVGLENLGRMAATAITPHLYRGTILDREGVTWARAKKVVAEPADYRGPVLLDVDGEAPGGLPATFEMRAGAIQLRA
jgi:YegS/Rv2252/BmrU family lipid kinase